MSVSFIAAVLEAIVCLG
jgi:hypothetical protein